MFNSLLRFLLTNIPAQEVHAHSGGHGKAANARRKAAKSGASGGGLTPNTDAKKQELVRKLSQKALKDPKNFRKTTSLTSRKIVANFQLQKQTTGKDYSTSIAKSIRRNKEKTTGISNRPTLKKPTGFRVSF